ncbi:MAG: HAMP domain-containing histidine kinase [Acidobacteriota bacterium]|nr:HAMP domain-containing histidine kinase [Acidobacteriota bacterium]
MTLRLRLLLVLVGIVAAGLVVADVVTYNQLGSFLYGRTDQQLASSAPTAQRALSQCLSFGEGAGGCNLRFPPGTSLPVGTYFELLDANGGVVLSLPLGEAQSAPAPALPGGLPGSNGSPASSNPPPAYLSASAASGTHYRVLAQAVEINGQASGTLVVALPTTDISSTLGHLVWIETLVTAGVLLLLGALSWWIVRRGLRPLDDMTETAGAIAQGDLAQRVPDAGGGTEVGRLGVALNTMLANIEQAFAARAASEERLRRFLADASHELRTPLTSIRGYAEMFDRGARDRPEDLATSMRHIRNEADRMSELVNDLLLLARLDQERPLERARVELGDVVEAAVASARVSAPERAISYSHHHPVAVEGDASRLRQVVDNLLANASRHTPPGTPVDVRLGTDATSALLEVEDRGPGVAPEDEARIFEPFHRADDSRARATGGMGLGLAIVAAITRAHGGSAGVRSNPAGGATFWVTLPLAALDGSGPAPEAAAPPATAAPAVADVEEQDAELAS